MTGTSLDRGVYLTAKGLENVRSIYGSFRKSIGEERRKLLSDAQKILLGDRWHDFDALYAGLYAANLARNDAVAQKSTVLPDKLEPNPGHPDAFRPMGDEFFKHAILRVLIDAKLPEQGSNDEFSKTLIDEFLVSDLLLFRASVEDMLPFKTRIERFSLGCIWIEFGIYGLPLSPTELNSFLRREAIEGDTEHFNPWWTLRQRFHVGALELETLSQ